MTQFGRTISGSQGYLAIVKVPLNSRWQTTVSSAYSSVSPIANIIPPYLCFKFCHSVVLGLIITAVKQLLFHPCPQTFASGIVMTATASTVHTLNYSILLYCCTIFCTCVLTSSVGMYDTSIDVRVRFLCIFKGMTAKRSSHYALFEKQKRLGRKLYYFKSLGVTYQL